MGRWRVKPTRADKALADAVLRHADTRVEHTARIVTLAADERVLLAVTVTAWLLSRLSSAERTLRDMDHLALSVAATALIPHLLKDCFAQPRPDRRVHGMRHGIPRSGEPRDAFPSGHAMHMGAIASAVSW